MLIIVLCVRNSTVLVQHGPQVVSMATKMATVDKAEELLEKLWSASWNTAVQEKREGPWINEFVSRSRVLSRNGTTSRLSIAHMVCNQTPPFGNRPILMTFSEVQTVFHEFGHALQIMLTKQDEGLVAGMNGIERDAVDLPSWKIGVTTGENLPEEVYLKLLAARTFRSSSQCLRAVKLASLDLELHTKYIPDGSESVYDVDRRVSRKTEGAEVLAADAFSAFEEAGLEDKKVWRLRILLRIGVLQSFVFFYPHLQWLLKKPGASSERLFALGGGKAPMEVFVEFCGRQPSPEALLRHNGLLPATQPEHKLV
ncbi:putative cytosolic oligopeptidase A [Hibiscus syriacus]|uniref:Cytosolic oligopeptidase A n=1 Tax=Hibiscus syriacus TaxID=106335 RepID=A0A6A3AE80_HIBSY|nr:putative cytosolic oligopeptidase A [Hibiscus syriacus]